jgi:hypothetical protein
LHHPELLYFADVCAGPGGFSEYVLWRSKAEAKGFGMTLRGSCDFKLEDFFAGPAEMFGIVVLVVNLRKCQYQVTPQQQPLEK